MAKTPLFNPNDGLTGRNGGPYLDEVQAQQDEIRRAAIEGREPDLTAPGANAGIQLSTAAQMLATLNVQNNPSMETAQATAVQAVFANPADSGILTTPVFDEIPDLEGEKGTEDVDTLTFNTTDPNAPGSAISEEDANTDEGEVPVDLFEPDAPEAGPAESVKSSGEVTGDSTTTATK